jgi:hypothetical protein
MFRHITAPLELPRSAHICPRPAASMASCPPVIHHKFNGDNALSFPGEKRMNRPRGPAAASDGL